MKAIIKLFAAGACFVVMMNAEIVPGAPLKLSFFHDAQAIIGVAPGGSVVRRRAVVATTAVVATSSANASAAANANAAAAASANAAAANANAAAAQAAAGPPPVGTMVTSLPPGCASTNLNGVDYMRCDATYYRASMMGNNLVFVVAQP